MMLLFFLQTIQEFNSLKEELTLAILNRYNSADLMFLFREGLSFIIRRLSSNSNTNFLFSLVSTLKFSKDGKWLQSIK